MKLHLSFCLFFFLIQNSISLNSKNFCQLTEKECIGITDQSDGYKVKCELEKCSFPYNHECANRMCATNKTDCLEYNSLDILLKTNVFKSITQIPFLDGLKLKEVKKKYDKTFKVFIGSIQSCPKKEYTFSTGDVCVSSKFCFRKIENNAFLNIFRFSSQNKYSWKMVKCVCPAIHSYHCGENHCSINKKACDSFNSDISIFGLQTLNKCPV